MKFFLSQDFRQFALLFKPQCVLILFSFMLCIHPLNFVLVAVCIDFVYTTGSYLKGTKYICGTKCCRIKVCK